MQSIQSPYARLAIAAGAAVFTSGVSYLYTKLEIGRILYDVNLPEQGESKYTEYTRTALATLNAFALTVGVGALITLGADMLARRLTLPRVSSNEPYVLGAICSAILASGALHTSKN